MLVISTHCLTLQTAATSDPHNKSSIFEKLSASKSSVLDGRQLLESSEE